jgi:hypothetical protein
MRHSVPPSHRDGKSSMRNPPLTFTVADPFLSNPRTNWCQKVRIDQLNLEYDLLHNAI